MRVSTPVYANDLLPHTSIVKIKQTLRIEKLNGYYTNINGFT